MREFKCVDCGKTWYSSVAHGKCPEGGRELVET